MSLIFTYIIGFTSAFLALGCIGLWTIYPFEGLNFMFFLFSYGSYYYFNHEINYVFSNIKYLDKTLSSNIFFTIIVFYVILIIMMFYEFNIIYFTLYLFIGYLFYRYFNFKLNKYRDMRLR